MAQRSQPPDDDAVRGGDDIDEVLSRANPNPERIGCPPRDALIGLARRAQPIGDPAYEHLVKCSPCYCEFRKFQGEGSMRPSAPTTGSQPRWMAGAAVVVLTAGLAGIWFYMAGRTSPVAPTAGSPSQAAEVRTTELDLRKFTATRSQQSGIETAPVVLPTGLVNLTLLMPVGSEPGAYDIQLLDADLQSKASAHAAGEIRDYVTTLRTTLDLRGVQPGTYQLAVRRGGDDWRLFPAQVR